MNSASFLTEVSQLSNEASICLANGINQNYWLFHHHRFIIIKLTSITDTHFTYIECQLNSETKQLTESKTVKKLPIKAKNNMFSFHIDIINPHIHNLSYIPHLHSYPEIVYNIKERHNQLKKCTSFLNNNHIICFNNSNTINKEINNHLVYIKSEKGKVINDVFELYVKGNKEKFIIWNKLIEMFAFCNGELKGIIMFKNMKKYNIFKGKVLYLQSEILFEKNQYYSIFSIIINKIYNVLFGKDTNVNSISKMILHEYSQYKIIIEKVYSIISINNKNDDSQFDLFISLLQKLALYNKSVLKRIFNLIITIPVILQGGFISHYEELSQACSLLKISKEVLNDMSDPFSFSVFLYNELIHYLFKYVNLFLNQESELDNAKENMIMISLSYKDLFEDSKESLLYSYLNYKIKEENKESDNESDFICKEFENKVLPIVLSCSNIDNAKKELLNSSFSYFKFQKENFTIKRFDTLQSFSYNNLLLFFSSSYNDYRDIMNDYYKTLCKCMIISKFDNDTKNPKLKKEAYKLLKYFNISNNPLSTSIISQDSSINNISFSDSSSQSNTPSKEKKPKTYFEQIKGYIDKIHYYSEKYNTLTIDYFDTFNEESLYHYLIMNNELENIKIHRLKNKKHFKLLLSVIKKKLWKKMFDVCIHKITLWNKIRCDKVNVILTKGKRYFDALRNFINLRKEMTVVIQKNIRGFIRRKKFIKTIQRMYRHYFYLKKVLGKKRVKGNIRINTQLMIVQKDSINLYISRIIKQYLYLIKGLTKVQKRFKKDLSFSYIVRLKNIIKIKTIVSQYLIGKYIKRLALLYHRKKNLLNRLSHNIKKNLAKEKSYRLLLNYKNYLMKKTINESLITFHEQYQKLHLLLKFIQFRYKYHLPIYDIKQYKGVYSRSLGKIMYLLRIVQRINYSTVYNGLIEIYRMHRQFYNFQLTIKKVYYVSIIKTFSKIKNQLIKFIYFYKRIFQRHFFHALINYNNNLQTNEQNIQNLYTSITQKIKKDTIQNIKEKYLSYMSNKRTIGFKFNNLIVRLSKRYYFHFVLYQLKNIVKKKKIASTFLLLKLILEKKLRIDVINSIIQYNKLRDKKANSLIRFFKQIVLKKRKEESYINSKATIIQKATRGYIRRKTFIKPIQRVFRNFYYHKRILGPIIISNYLIKVNRIKVIQNTYRQYRIRTIHKKNCLKKLKNFMLDIIQNKDRKVLTSTLLLRKYKAFYSIKKFVSLLNIKQTIFNNLLVTFMKMKRIMILQSKYKRLILSSLISHILAFRTISKQYKNHLLHKGVQKMFTLQKRKHYCIITIQKAYKTFFKRKKDNCSYQKLIHFVKVYSLIKLIRKFREIIKKILFIQTILKRRYKYHLTISSYSQLRISYKQCNSFIYKFLLLKKVLHSKVSKVILHQFLSLHDRNTKLKRLRYSIMKLYYISSIKRIATFFKTINKFNSLLTVILSRKVLYTIYNKSLQKQQTLIYLQKTFKLLEVKIQKNAFIVFRQKSQDNKSIRIKYYKDLSQMIQTIKQVILKQIIKHNRQIKKSTKLLSSIKKTDIKISSNSNIFSFDASIITKNEDISNTSITLDDIYVINTSTKKKKLNHIPSLKPSKISNNDSSLLKQLDDEIDRMILETKTNIKRVSTNNSKMKKELLKTSQLHI